MPISTQNGFSEQEINQCKGWQLPDVSDGSSIAAPVSKNQDNTSTNKISKTESEKNDKNETIEVIEDVELDTIDKQSQVISAEELASITDAAEKEGYKTGFEKGLAEGQQEGLASGLVDAKQTIVDQSQRLGHIIEALLTPIENEKKQIEKLLVDMTCRLTETLLERELKTDSSIITKHIDSVLSLLPQTIPRFTLYLNPDDIALVETHLEKTLLADSAAGSVQYQLKADDTLMLGGCRLESNQTSVDASMEAKLANLLSSFVEKRHDKKTAEPSANSENPADTQNIISEEPVTQEASAQEGDAQEVDSQEIDTQEVDAKEVDVQDENTQENTSGDDSHEADTDDE